MLSIAAAHFPTLSRKSGEVEDLKTYIDAHAYSQSLPRNNDPDEILISRVDFKPEETKEVDTFMNVRDVERSLDPTV